MIGKIVLIAVFLQLAVCLRTIPGFINTTDVQIQVQPFDNVNRFVHRVPVKQNGLFEVPIFKTNTSYLLTIESTSQTIHPDRFRIDILDPNKDLEEYKIWSLEYGDEFSAISDQNRVSSLNITEIVEKKFIELRNKPFMESNLVMYLKLNPTYVMMALVLAIFGLIPVVLNYIDPEVMEKA